jgi:cephalosporin hydroxylase
MTVRSDHSKGAAQTQFGPAPGDIAKSFDAASEEASKIALAATGEGKVVIAEVQAGTEQWMTWAQKAFQVNLNAWQGLMACRSPQAAAQVQGRLIHEQTALLMDNSRRATVAMVRAATAK